MSPACLQGKQYVLLSRKSYINSEAHSAYKPLPEWEVHAACCAWSTALSDSASSQYSQHQKGPKILQLSVIFCAEVTPPGAKQHTGMTLISSLHLTKHFQGNSSSKAN